MGLSSLVPSIDNYFRPFCKFSEVMIHLQLQFLPIIFANFLLSLPQALEVCTMSLMSKDPGQSLIAYAQNPVSWAISLKSPEPCTLLSRVLESF